MSAYYNEIDTYCAQWLRNLIAAGHIAPGVVDERSIEDIAPDELREFSQVHMFAGIGVWSHALRLAGWDDSRPCWTGSAPCQPFSAAGKGAGFADQRHLWPAWFHLIRECRPGVVFGEQVASRDVLDWLDLVQADLEGAQYASGAIDLCAAGVGAPHVRQRLYFMAHTNGARQFARQQRGSALGYRQAAESDCSAQQLGDAKRHGLRIGGRSAANEPDQSNRWSLCDWIACRDGKARPVEPGTQPLAHGVANRVEQLRAYGNAICGPLAEIFIRSAMECIG